MDTSDTRRSSAQANRPEDDSHANEPATSSGSPDDRREQAGRTAVQIAITAIAIAALVLRQVLPNFHADNITLALVVIAFLPWLGLVFKSFEVPGLGKVEFLERKVRTLEEQQRVSNENSSLAAGAASILVAGKAGAALEADGGQTLSNLANKYDEMRRTMPSGWQRTSELAKVFGQMAAAAANADQFDVRRALSAGDEGTRITGIAYLFARPDPGMMDELISTITQKETAAFNQYWGLKTVQNILDHGGKLSDQSRKKLTRYAANVERRDRYRETMKILRRSG